MRELSNYKIPVKKRPVKLVKEAVSIQDAVAPVLDEPDTELDAQPEVEDTVIDMEENWLFKSKDRSNNKMKKLNMEKELRIETLAEDATASFAPEASIVDKAVQTLGNVPEAVSFISAFKDGNRAEMELSAKAILAEPTTPPEARDAVRAILYKSDVQNTATAAFNGEQNRAFESRKKIKESTFTMGFAAALGIIVTEIPKLIAKFNEPMRSTLSSMWSKKMFPVVKDFTSYAKASEEDRKSVLEDLKDFAQNHAPEGKDKDSLLWCLDRLIGAPAQDTSEEKTKEEPSEKKESKMKKSQIRERGQFPSDMSIDMEAASGGEGNIIVPNKPVGIEEPNDPSNGGLEAIKTINTSAENYPAIEDQIRTFVGIASRLLSYGPSNEVAQRAQTGGQGERLKSCYDAIMADSSFKSTLGVDADAIMNAVGGQAPIQEKTRGDVWLTKTETALGFSSKNAIKVITESCKKFIADLQDQGNKEDCDYINGLVKTLVEAKEGDNIKPAAAELIDTLTEIGQQYRVKIAERTQTAFDVLISTGLVSMKESRNVNMLESVVEWDGTVRSMTADEKEWRKVLED